MLSVFLCFSLILTCSHFLYLPLTLTVSPFAVCFSEWREHQRDQAGLAYCKQMADQRQEGHSFTKRGLNMPGPCRGACPWMMATWCVSVCMYESEHLGGDSWFCRLPIWEMRSANHSLSLRAFSFSLCSGKAPFERLVHQWLLCDLVALRSLTTVVLLYNQISKAGGYARWLWV